MQINLYRKIHSKTTPSLQLNYVLPSFYCWSSMSIRTSGKPHYLNLILTSTRDNTAAIFLPQSCTRTSFVEIFKKLKSTYQEIQHPGITPLICYTIGYLLIIKIKFDKIIPSDVLFSHVFKYPISFYLIIIDEHWLLSRRTHTHIFTCRAKRLGVRDLQCAWFIHYIYKDNTIDTIIIIKKLFKLFLIS